MSKRPTFGQYMLEHGMNEPDRIPALDLEKWKVRYMLEHPTEPETAPETPADEPKP